MNMKRPQTLEDLHPEFHEFLDQFFDLVNKRLDKTEITVVAVADGDLEGTMHSALLQYNMDVTGQIAVIGHLLGRLLEETDDTDKPELDKVLQSFKEVTGITKGPHPSRTKMN
jgi:hypothetical protein